MKMKALRYPQGYWWPDVFYNIGYRAYAKDVKVESVSKQILENARSLLEEAGNKLLNNPEKSA